MTTAKTAREELAEAKRIETEAGARKEALLAQLREEDLATVKALIDEHGFKSAELRPELKGTRTAKVVEVVPAKKAARKNAKK